MPPPTVWPINSSIVWSVLFLLALSSGCSARKSVFEIVDLREPGQPQRYTESFDEAYYTINDSGGADIVLRRRKLTSRDPAVLLTQTIHLHSVWRSVPGRTVAESSQINGTVTYAIIKGRIGATFEGAGSLFFHQNRRKNVLTGSLDTALLQPERKLAAGADFFDQAELRGEFRAVRDRRQVVRIINDMNRLFGVRPPYELRTTSDR